MTAPPVVHRPSTGARLTLRRSWPRGDGHLLVEYADPDGSAIAGQWFADDDRLHRRAARTPAPAELVPATGVLLQPGGADSRIPALRRLLHGPGGTLVAHRPERRAVVRLGGPGATSYAKLVRPGRSAALAASISWATTDATGAFAVPDLLRHDPDEATVVLTALPGRTLHEAGADPTFTSGDLGRAWAAVGHALHVLHDGAGSVPAGVPWHGQEREHDTTVGWLDAAARHGLLPSQPLDRELDELRDGRRGPLGLVHRDLHDKQLMLRADGTVGVVDLDTLAIGERALDLANVLAHLDLRVTQGLLSAARAETARDRFLSGYAPDEATLARIPAYLAAASLRLRAVYAFRPAWRTIVVARHGRYPWPRWLTRSTSTGRRPSSTRNTMR